MGSILLIYTCGNSYCYKIWKETIIFTLILSVAGLFYSFFLLLSNLVHVIWEKIAAITLDSNYRLTRAAVQFCCPIAGAMGYFTMGIEWLKKTTKTEVLECDNGEHRTHAFDINGAFSAYLSIILFILYSIDVFIKHKELKEIKCPDE